MYMENVCSLPHRKDLITVTLICLVNTDLKF